MPVWLSRLKGPSAKRVLLAVAIIALVTCALRVPLLGIPFERDEGEYSYIAWRLGHGELPYRDWVDQKPPAVFWVYRVALALPLEPVRAVHLMGLIFSVLSASALFFLARRVMSGFWSGAAGVLFVLLSVDPRVQGTAANTEVFMLLPLVLSLLAFLSATEEEGRRRVRFMVLAGALTGIAVTFKQVAAVNWFFLAVVFPLFIAKEKRWRDSLLFAVWSAGGVALVWGVIAIYFWLRHGFGEFIYNVFSHNLEYISAIPWPTRWKLLCHTLGHLSPTQAVVWAGLAAGLVMLGLSGRRKWLLFVGGWLVTSLVGVSASGYYFPHYFQQLAPVLCFGAALGAEGLCGASGWSRVPAWGRKAALGLALACLPAAGLCPFLFSYTPAEASWKIYPGDFFSEMPEMAARLAKVTSPQERVFVFGAEPELLFYARRVSASRYIFLFPLYGPYRNVRQTQISAAAEIVRAQPAAMACFPNNLFFLHGEQYFTEWTRTYLVENFRADTYLTYARPRVVRLATGEDGRDPAVLPGERIVGGIMLRRKAEAMK